MNFQEFMRKWATDCQSNPWLAIVSLPFIILISMITAIVLFLKGDKRWKKCI